MFNNDHIDILIARDLEGRISAEEQAQLKAWLEENAANREYYQAMKMTWDLTGEALPETTQEPDVARNWEQFRIKLDRPQPAGRDIQQDTIVVPLSRKKIFLRIAAAAVVVLVAAGLVFTLFQHNTVLITAEANKKEVILPDGSKVFLNRNSQLSYHDDFGSDNRMVELKGEAFFDVKTDANKPFIVVAGASQTEVLGTSFVLKAYEAQTIQLSVVTGKVAFSEKRHEKDALVITAGNSAMMKGDKIPQRVQQDDPNFMAWKENKLHFNDVPLKKFFTTVEAYFNIKIEVADSSILDLTITSDLDHPTVEEVMEVVKVAAEVRYEETAPRVYRISK